MALIHVKFYSKILGMQRSMDVIMPQKDNGVGLKSGDNGNKIPVLYLLHGASDDHTIWQRRTSIERYALEKGLAVIMPSTDLGFYADMKYGYDFWKFFSREIFDIVSEFFPGISTERMNTFAAGLSMGGFGALKLGIMCPGRFAAAASLSGMVDLVSWYEKNMDKQFELIYGTKEEAAGSINDLPYQMEQLIASGKSMPKFYVTCGTEDFLYPMNAAFRDRFKDRIDLTYHEEPGIHEWGYWDRNIRRIIDWLPIKVNKKEVNQLWH